MVGILHQYVLEQYWTMEIGQMEDILQQLHLIWEIEVSQGSPPEVVVLGTIELLLEQMV